MSTIISFIHLTQIINTFYYGNYKTILKEQTSM